MYDDELQRPIHEISLAEFLGGGNVRLDIALSDDDWVYLPASAVDMSKRESVEQMTGYSLEGGHFDQYSLAPLRNGRDVVLLYEGEAEEFEAVGLYAGESLNIVPAHRGKGLAPVLILAAAGLRGGVPNHGDYTQSGDQAHRRAHRLAVVWAVEAGHDVPEVVLADYPDLVGNAPQP